MIQSDYGPKLGAVETSSPIWIRLLGNFLLYKAGLPAVSSNSAKTDMLVSLLALHYNSGVPRETLLMLLWPTQDNFSATQSLNSLIYSVRQQLRPALDGANPLLYTGNCYQLNLEAGIAIDVAMFEDLIQKGMRLFRNGEYEKAIALYEQAVSLYGGDLENVTDTFATIERERLRARYLTILAQIADYYFEQMHYANSLDYAQRLLSSDPCREDAHRLVMRCYVRLGHRAQALRHYQLCVALLDAEFGVMPELTTTALFEQIRRQPDLV